MSYTTNIINAESCRAHNDIIGAIKEASQSSGVNFSYLVNQAAAESNFNPTAEAKTSSASGLYQFIDSTWLSMIDRYGSDYGIETDGKSKSEILDMRKDPQTSSFMAAAFASENEKSLNNNWGGDVGSTELYFAHFMGASGAASFLNAHDENPMQPAADLFPRAARANRNVFYNPDNGKPRSLEEVYSFFDNKFQAEETNSPTMIAQAPIPRSTPAQKLAGNDLGNSEMGISNRLYSASRNLSDSVIMQRAQAMRDAAGSRSTYANALSGFEDLNKNERNSLFATPQAKQSSIFKKQASNSQGPLLGLLAQPLDLMVLTQTATPSKVIDDKG